jgi:uncharacterized repeat protein (TIGR03806 family)
VTFRQALALAAAVCAAPGCGSDGKAPPGPRPGIATRPLNATCKPPVSANAPAALLSQTGCVDPADPKRPAAGLIPYDVASPLWSDGADKERFFALPDGARIRVKDCSRAPAACVPPSAGGTPEDDGHWELPVGTVLVKAFRMGGRHVETRLLVRLDAFTWKGYSYKWNDAQTDAEVLPDVIDGLREPVAGGGGSQLWHYPSRAQCLQCHHTAAGISLGLTSAQLNREYAYPSGVTENQLVALERIGLFEAPLPTPAPPVLADPRAAALAVEARARSYLHANCANCHRPGGSFEGIDLRRDTPLAATGMCNRPPEKGDQGIGGALLLVPGDPERSLLSVRMRRLEAGRMPQIGTSVLDSDGVRVVEDWIRSIRSCP